jgi:hypothetical protein
MLAPLAHHRTKGIPIEPSYMSSRGGGWGVAGSQPTSTAVHINFEDLTPYFNLWFKHSKINKYLQYVYLSPLQPISEKLIMFKNPSLIGQSTHQQGQNTFKLYAQNYGKPVF